MKKAAFFIRILVMDFVVVLGLCFSGEDGPYTKLFQNYTSQVDKLTGLDTVELLEKGKQVADSLDAFGVPTAKAVSILIQEGVDKLKPDLHNALELHHNETTLRFNKISTQLTNMQNNLQSKISSTAYEERIFLPIVHLLDVFKKCSSPLKFTEHCKQLVPHICIRYRPFEILRSIHVGTNGSCSIPSPSTIAQMIYVTEQFEFFEEHKINFNTIDYFKQKAYQEHKLRRFNNLNSKNYTWPFLEMLSSLLTGILNVNELEEDLIDLKLADEIHVDETIKFFKKFSKTTRLLGLKFFKNMLKILYQLHK
jgi:hypothetical protein